MTKKLKEEIGDILTDLVASRMTENLAPPRITYEKAVIKVIKTVRKYDRPN